MDRGLMAMGMIHTEITLKNAFDEEKASEGLIKQNEVRAVTVNAVVDTGAASLVINEELRQKLGLGIEIERSARVADGRRVLCKVTKPVKILWKNRRTSCEAMVIPGAETVLLGAIALEGMDLMVNPVAQELVGVHGDTEEYLVL
jgi:clan AA aspartic protease